jgi:hypothetical protein
LFFYSFSIRIETNVTNYSESHEPDLKKANQDIRRSVARISAISSQIPHPPPGLPLEGEGNILSDVLITDILATNILIS